MSIGTDWTEVDLASTDWMRFGLCAQTGMPDLWHPEKGSGRATTREAKAVCKRCPEALMCLRYALERPYLSGVWGATSDKERQHLRSKGEERAA